MLAALRKASSYVAVPQVLAFRTSIEGGLVPRPVVHFEIIGKDPVRLRSYYGELFGWDYDTSGPVPPEISEAGGYGFVEATTTEDGVGIPGGVGGGDAYDASVYFYVGVDDVEAALEHAEQLGGTRRLGPTRVPGTDLVVGHFADPEGNLIGVAGG